MIEKIFIIMVACSCEVSAMIVFKKKRKTYDLEKQIDVTWFLQVYKMDLCLNFTLHQKCSLYDVKG